MAKEDKNIKTFSEQFQFSTNEHPLDARMEPVKYKMNLPKEAYPGKRTYVEDEDCDYIYDGKRWIKDEHKYAIEFDEEEKIIELTVNGEKAEGSTEINLITEVTNIMDNNLVWGGSEKWND